MILTIEHEKGFMKLNMDTCFNVLKTKDFRRMIKNIDELVFDTEDKLHYMEAIKEGLNKNIESLEKEKKSIREEYRKEYHQATDVKQRTTMLRKWANRIKKSESLIKRNLKELRFLAERIENYERKFKNPS